MLQSIEAHPNWPVCMLMSLTTIHHGINKNMLTLNVCTDYELDTGEVQSLIHCQSDKSCGKGRSRSKQEK